MVVLGTTIHEFACNNEKVPVETHGWAADGPSPTMTENEEPVCRGLHLPTKLV
jgi:hypothetical protein